MINLVDDNTYSVQCILKGSLAYTGKGHSTDRAVLLGLHGYLPTNLAHLSVEDIVAECTHSMHITIQDYRVAFDFNQDLIFDLKEPLPQHPNGMIFNLYRAGELVFSEQYFSIGGGFVYNLEQVEADAESSEDAHNTHDYPYPYANATEMLDMADKYGISIAEMKKQNELCVMSQEALNTALDDLRDAMFRCIQNGLKAKGILPGVLQVRRRARYIHKQLTHDENATFSDWLSVYAMAVNEENAAGHMVVTAPTNGAAGVLPAVLYYFYKHQNASDEQMRDFLLTAAAIGGIIKHNSSISGAEIGCQGEVGSASAMAAAGLCAARGGTPQQVENASEMALEHHLGMTCDPIAGLVQVPCIERNAFGAVKAFMAVSLALKEDGNHLVSLDNCIKSMKQIGDEMSHKFKETSLGGLAVNITEC